MCDVMCHNSLKAVLDEMIRIKDQLQGCRLVWFGNARDIILMNECMKEYGIGIRAVIDNDESKWGKEIGEVYSYSYYNEIIQPSVREQIYIASPDSIVKDGKKNKYMIFSRHEAEMTKQLLDLGVSENDIYCFADIANENFYQEFQLKERFQSCKKLGIREMQLLELEILKDFRAFCESNHLRYYLSSGSLIGALRHKGFIPWDDDIDVFMPYEDYLKFVNTYPSSGRYRALDWTTDSNYFLPFGKLVDTNTYLIHRGYPIQMVMGVYIDIFPLSGYKKGENPQVFWDRNVQLDDEWREYYIARSFFQTELPDVREKIMAERYQYSVDEAEVVGARHIISGVKQWCIKKEIYEDTVDVFFEDGYFKAAAGYHELLTMRYGDYMKLPPVEERVIHGFDAYLKEG